MAKTQKSKAGFTPLGDRVLVEIPPREEKTASGIIIPDTVSDDRTDTKRGKVIAVGEGKYDDGKLVPLQVKAGDEVLFEWGTKIEMDDKEYHIVNESNILGVIS